MCGACLGQMRPDHARRVQDSLPRGMTAMDPFARPWQAVEDLHLT